jgi:hypothetical protein
MGILTWFHSGNLKKADWESLAKNLIQKDPIKATGDNIINFQERA